MAHTHTLRWSSFKGVRSLRISVRVPTDPLFHVTHSLRTLRVDAGEGLAKPLELVW